MQAALEHLSAAAAAVLGRPLSRNELEMFRKYLATLQKWQRVQRLVGSVDPAWVVENPAL